jgi:hypothetical protein
MKQLSFHQLLSAPIAKGSTTPDPNGATLVWSTTAAQYLGWNGSSWESLIYDPALQQFVGLNSFGFVVRQSGTGNIVTRVLAGTADQIQITNPDGVTNPAIGLTDTGVIPGTYPKVEVDAQGRIRSGGPLSAEDIPEDYLQLYDEKFTAAAPNTVTGNDAIAIGDGSAALATNSFAIGQQAVARHRGAFVYAAGRFASQGDAQVGRYILKAVTTNNFQRELYLDGPSLTTPLILPDHSTWTFTATITAHQTDGTGNRAGYIIKGVIYRQSGVATVAFQGTPAIETISSSNPNWVINTIANNVNGSLSFVVQGESGVIIRWMANVETVEITN